MCPYTGSLSSYNVEMQGLFRGGGGGGGAKKCCCPQQYGAVLSVQLLEAPIMSSLSSADAVQLELEFFFFGSYFTKVNMTPKHGFVLASSPGPPLTFQCCTLRTR